MPFAVLLDVANNRKPNTHIHLETKLKNNTQQKYYE